MTDDKAQNFGQDALNFHYQECQRLTAQLQAAEARLAAAAERQQTLAAAVVKWFGYSWHSEDCGIDEDVNTLCTCGLQAARDELNAALAAAPAPAASPETQPVGADTAGGGGRGGQL